MHEAGALASVIQKVERKVLAADPSLGAGTAEAKANLDKIVGEILATDMKTIGNTTISIFDREFEDYRKNAPLYDYIKSPNTKDDDDYLTQKSEVTLLPQNFYDHFLQIRSPGEFANENQAVLFLTQIIDRYGEIRHGGNGLLQASFLEDVKKKLNDALTKSAHLAKGAVLAGRKFKSKGGGDEFVIATLLEHGLIDREIFKEQKLLDMVDEQRTNKQFRSLTQR